MSFITGQEASQMFVKFHDSISIESDRGAVLVSAALLDEGLKGLIKARLVRDSSQQDTLFDGGNAPLGTFSSRIEMSFRLGLISDSVKSVLNIFRRLRNDFAHSFEQVSLDHTSAKSRFDTILSQHGDIRDALKETAFRTISKVFEENGIEQDPDSFYQENWPVRATFDSFFAMTAMAIHRLANEVVHIERNGEQDAPSDGDKHPV